MPWLLSIEVDGQPMYWTGRIKRGGPQKTLWKADAVHFGTAKSARECASTHDQLRDSDEWRVVKR